MIGVDDITMVMGVRVHEGNPWVIPRLSLMGRHYQPRPRVVVVDFGSAGQYRDALHRACDSNGFDCVVRADSGVFSQAIARNVGAAHTRTELIFFNDVDCLGESDLFVRLVRLANALDVGRCFDQVLSLPAYHLSERATRGVVVAPPDARDLQLAQAMAQSVDTAMGDVSDYVDPFSNFFLCHREFFSLTGGYDETFRGHGSEDYEFMIRSQVHSGQYPLPADVLDDVYGPTRPDYFGPRAYRGFRRLGELTSYQCETSGCRIAHLHHPRPGSAVWYKNNDWKRLRFAESVSATLGGWTGLLGRDWLPRRHAVTAVVGADWHAQVLLPLRLRGYDLEPKTVPAGTELSMALSLASEGAKGVAVVLPSYGARERDAFDDVRGAPNSELVIAHPSGRDRVFEFAFGAGRAEHVRAQYVVDPQGALRFAQWLDQPHERFERVAVRRPFELSSYAAGRLSVNVGLDEAGEVAAHAPEHVARRLPPHVAAEPARKRLGRRARKLVTNPRRFLDESRFSAVRRLGRLLTPK